MAPFSIKKMIIAASLFCTVNTRADIDWIAVVKAAGVAAAPAVAGAAYSTYLYFNDDRCEGQTASEAAKEYFGSFGIGVTPPVNALAGVLMHESGWRRHPIMRTGYQAGIATDIAVMIAATMLYNNLNK